MSQTSSSEVRRGDMRYRRFGSTGAEVSLVGLGGSHFAKAGEERAAIRLVRQAIDRGITFMDNSWDYGAGQSEIWMGKALKNGYRERVFLMSKIDGRTKQAAAKQIDESLLRLQVGFVDLMQFHELVYPHDPDLILKPGGAAEAMLEAQKAGKVRFIGFTGHKDPFIHLRMLTRCKEAGLKIDAVQMPINVMDAHFRSFEHEVLPRLNEDGIASIGMKSMCGGQAVNSHTATPIQCLQYAMTAAISTLVVGIDSPEILDQAISAVKDLDSFDYRAREQVVAMTKTAAMSGEFEPFKTTPSFDSTQKHPDWLGI